MSYVDSCKTAEDVRQLAAKVRRVRAMSWQSRTVAKLVEVPAEKEPEPMPRGVIPYAARRETPKMDDIFDAVCSKYGCTLIDLKSQRRQLVIVRPRQIAMYLATQLTLKSLPEIGRDLGGKDHTTILHGKRKIESMMASDVSFAAEVKALLCEIMETFNARNAKFVSPRPVGQDRETQDAATI